MIKSHSRSYFFGDSGNRLHVQEWGDLHKPVVLLLHGFVGCADQAKLMSFNSHWDSIRMIAVDRPGYGHSEPQYRCTPVKFAQQMIKLLDEQNISDVNILSVSGGAPYSMALAHALGKRVRKLTSVSGIAPLTLKNWSDINPFHKKAFVFQKTVPQPVARYLLNKVWAKNRHRMDEIIFGSVDTLAEHDQKVFKDPKVGRLLLETTKFALEKGPGGVLLDMKVYSQKWGFSFQQINCPVTIWHGEQDDVVDRKFAFELKQHLPHAQLKIVSGEGHYSLLLNRLEDIFGDLIQTAEKAI